jgi:hypothetical protein
MRKEKRYKEENVLFVGLWVGNSKPDFNAFLSILVNDLSSLEAGVKMVDPNRDQIKVRARLIRMTFDLPARAGVLHQIGHGGRCPCSFCYIQGVYTENNQRYCYAFAASSIESDSKLRTREETDSIYQELLSRTQNNEFYIIRGLKAIPRLNVLEYWSMTDTTVIDAMHLIMGVTKTIVKVWSQTIPKSDWQHFDSLLTQQSLSLRYTER